MVSPEGGGVGDVGQREVFGDKQRDVLERLQHYIARTPPAKRCPCQKGAVLVKASQHMGPCDEKPALIRKESELEKLEEGERVLKRQRLDIEDSFERAKLAAQGFEASW